MRVRTVVVQMPADIRTASVSEPDVGSCLVGQGSVQVYALLLDHVPACGLDILVRPEISSAAVARPDSDIGIDKTSLTETPRRSCFQGRHHLLGCRVGTDDQVNVVRTHVERVEHPRTIRTDIANRVIDDDPLLLVEAGTTLGERRFG